MPKPGFQYEVKENQHFCGIGFENCKTYMNAGIVFRSAVNLGCADFLFTIGAVKYNRPESDVARSTLTLPLWTFTDFKDLFDHQPMNCEIVGVELDDRAEDLVTFKHPKRAIYLFGGEEVGLSPQARKSCRHLVKLPSTGSSINLSSCASMVMWDRILKMKLGI